MKFIFLPPFEIFGRPLSSLHTQPSPAQWLPPSALIEYFKFDEADSWDHSPLGLRLAITVINVPRYRQCIFSLQPAAMINGTIASLTGILGSRNKFQDSGRSEVNITSTLHLFCLFSVLRIHILYFVSADFFKGITFEHIMFHSSINDIQIIVIILLPSVLRPLVFKYQQRLFEKSK